MKTRTWKLLRTLIVSVLCLGMLGSCVQAATPVTTAKSAALQHAGVKKSSTFRWRTESDVEDGIPEYEFTFFTRKYKYKYEIVKGTYEVLGFSRELRSKNKGKGSVISQEKAYDIAIADAGKRTGPFHLSK